MDKKTDQPPQCQCILDDGLVVVQEHLSKTRQILDRSKFQNDREFRRLVQSIQLSVDQLKEQQRAHSSYRMEFAREMVDLVKLNAINVGPLQEPLQTVPHLTGEKRIRQQETLQKSSGKKKRKQK